MTDLKSKTFSHGITKKTKKDLEREAEEKKRLEEERSVSTTPWIKAFDSGSFRQGTSIGHGRVRRSI